MVDTPQLGAPTPFAPVSTVETYPATEPYLDADPLASLAGDGSPSRAKKFAAWIGGGLLVLVAAYAGAQWLLADSVPRGTAIAGVNVGGLRSAEATAKLESELAPQVREPISLRAGGAATTVDPAQAGLTFDATASVANATGFSLQPARLWAHLFGGDAVAPVIKVDQEALTAAATQAAHALDTDPVDGTVAFMDGQAVATAAREGIAVSPDVVAQTIRSNWLIEPSPFSLSADPVPPQIDQAATDAAFAQAEKIVSGPVAVHVGDQTADLPASLLAEAATFEASGGKLVPHFDGNLLADGVLERTDNLIVPPQDSHFEFQDGRPVVVGGQEGTELSPDVVAAGVGTAALGDDRSAYVELSDVEPENSRQALEALGVNEVVASFATPITADAVRTQNLVRGGQLITGRLIKPGETFSLLDALAPINASNGFGSAGVILAGQHVQGMGGGLSQLATTVYNASFFAGFEDVAHTPHSEWITRYPPGREATIAVGSIDLQFRNNTPYGAVLQSWVSGGELHVAVWSTEYFRVETSASGKSNLRQPTTVERSGPDCTPQGQGQPGFTITNYRQVFRGSELVLDESRTWNYVPTNGVICVAPPGAEAPPPAPEAPAPEPEPPVTEPEPPPAEG